MALSIGNKVVYLRPYNEYRTCTCGGNVQYTGKYDSIYVKGVEEGDPEAFQHIDYIHKCTKCGTEYRLKNDTSPKQKFEEIPDGISDYDGKLLP